MVGGCGPDFIVQELSPMAASCEHDNEPLSYIKHEEIS